MHAGSGNGRVVLAASLLHDFERCVGIEILQNLHDDGVAALKVSSLARCEMQRSAMLAQRFDETLRSKLPVDSKSNLKLVHGRFEFSCFEFTRSPTLHSFLEVDWSDANVVFACSTWCALCSLCCRSFLLSATNGICSQKSRSKARNSSSALLVRSAASDLSHVRCAQ